MKKDKIQTIAVSGAMGALTIIMALTPIGLIPWFGGVSLTIMHIPVIIAAILEGPVAGITVGFIFGITTLIRAAAAPLSVLDILFVNPLVSVLPRILIGIVTWLVFYLFKGKLFIVSAWLASVLGSLTNTVFVLLALYLVYAKQLAEAFSASLSAVPKILITIVLTNGLLEAGAAAFITTAVLGAWLGVKKKKARLAKEEEK